MRYKVGDKVRVRGDLEAGKDYGGVPFLKRMEYFRNKIAEITKSEDGYYGLNINDICYAWMPEMLRLAEFKVWCETEEEKQAVLEELEKEGYVWKSGREKPTEPTYIGFFGKKSAGLYVQNDELSWDNDKQNFNQKNMTKLTPSEFTGIDFSHKSKKIIIEQTKTGAKATYKDKWSYVEGDFEEASRQALAEVLCPFRVGDKAKRNDLGFVYTVKNILLNGKIELLDSCGICSEVGVENLEPYTEPPYNAKLFCIEGHGVFKQGVVYTVENGIFIGVHDSHFKDLEDINKNLVSQFMEVKGGLND